jgi:hypothetical protein
MSIADFFGRQMLDREAEIVLSNFEVKQKGK